MSFLAQRRSGQVVALTMTTNGSSYSSPPAVTFSGGGGTGAAALAHMAGTQVESLVITNGGTGYSSAPVVTIAGNATATAAVYTGAIRPASFVRSRFNDLYVFDGMGRGLRWDGTAGTMQPLGIQKPQRGPTMTLANTGMAGYVDGVNIVAPGAYYYSAPSVTFSGGTPTKAAVGRAEVAAGRVVGITLSEPGVGYQSAPVVSLSASPAQGAAFTVGLAGSVEAVTVTAGGTNYTSAPTVVFSSEQKLTNGNARCIVESGVVTGIDILSGGTGATGPVAVTLVGGGGTGASLSVGMRYSVTAVTVTSGGTLFNAAPQLAIEPQAADTSASLAAVTATVASGSITTVTVASGGGYALPPSVAFPDAKATATATISNALRGKYKCAIRYIDATPESQRGPVCSSISDLVEVDVQTGAASLTWTLAHAGLDDRVHAVELWRTTADQSVLLFRVAKILRSAGDFTGTYTDNLSDDILSDVERDGYGLLPVTLPSGQLNARRFSVPPGNFAVACMFQDRCWLSVDTTGEKPNSLYYSEVDEPESIPLENEMVVQENAGDSDAVVALVPLGSALLAVQSRHLYRLIYVAQPVLDASITLAAYRGILNSKCWDVLGGVAYIADSYGLYAFDGNKEEAVSVAVDDFWRDRVIDFSKSSQFFVQADVGSKTVRFFFCRSGDSAPVRALVYCIATKAWWEERYASAITAGAAYAIGGQQGVAYGLSTGDFRSLSGDNDNGTAIQYRLRTGNMELTNEEGRQAVSITYTPTTDPADLLIRRHFNGSGTARLNAISTTRGDGISSAHPGAANMLKMQRTRSALGEANGVARIQFSGSPDERSAGGDRHVALAIAGTQGSTTTAPVLHAFSIEGVT